MSKYFKREEFECPCCKVNLIQDELVEVLDRARAIAGVPFVITSGYRCKSHNEEVGGSPTSSHLKGVAIDISVKDSHSRQLILKALLDVGFSRIGIAQTFIHADIDREKQPEVIWVYK